MFIKEVRSDKKKLYFTCSKLKNPELQFRVTKQPNGHDSGLWEATEV